jgi:CubicO group peptidase (beta-lactamase class C family)
MGVLRSICMKLTSTMLLMVLCAAGTACRIENTAALRQEQGREIEAMLREQMERQQVPGLAAAVIRDGEVVHQFTIGVSDVASKSPVTPSTPFQLASTTKTFSGTAVMLLVRDGQIRLDDPIGNFLEGLPPAWRGVTVRQLMSHTSGLPDVAVRPGQAELVADTWERAYPILAAAPLQFPPGEGWAYNQTNYVLLARIVERVSGRPLQDFMRSRIFEPLEMKDTYFPALEKRGPCATNYEPSGSSVKLRSLDFPRFVQAAAGLCSSLDDLVRWNRALDEGRVLPPELLRELWTPPVLTGSAVAAGRVNPGYGLGWAVDASAGKRSVGHSGGNSSAYRRYLDEGLTIIVLHNGFADPDDLVLWTSQLVRTDAGAAGAQEQLWDASVSGDTKKIDAALDAGANIEALDTRKSKNGRRALNWAASKNHPEAVRLLLKRGAAIDAPNLTGFTPLHHAAESGSHEAAGVLLSAGANRELRNKSGERPADVARGNNHEELAMLIESAGRK